MMSNRTYVFYFLMIYFLLPPLGVIGHEIEFPLLSISRVVKHSLGYPRDSLLNFTEITGQYGYSTEEHSVVTQDGYLLTVFRIARAKNCSGVKKRPPVILMHGLLQSSDSWIDSGPDAGLAYLIADACHDLWVGNCRGNYYSRRHFHLNPNKDSQYWKFSADEIGLYDVPATIDYVLQHTGSEKVNYIGFSQGAGVFTAMCSERPDYCDKAQVLIALAPATRMLFTTSPLFRVMGESMRLLEKNLAKSGVYEVFSKGSIFQETIEFLCQFLKPRDEFCKVLLHLLDSSHPKSITDKTLEVSVRHFPAGTSVHNIAWYGQSMRSQDYRKFDYGQRRNRKIYGKADPPKYNLSAVSVPVVVLYSNNDRVVDARDVKWLVERLPRVIDTIPVGDPLWNHMDNTYSQYTNEQIFPKINEYLFKFSP